MQSHRNLVAAAIAFALVSALALNTNAQDRRSRYSSSQYSERSWTLPADTVINVQLSGSLSSGTAHVGDKFTATVTVPVYVNGKTVIPAGTVVEGRVTQVTPAKRMNRSGTIGVDFDDLVFPNGAVVPLVGVLTSDDPETRRRIDDESRVSGEGNKRPSVFIGGGGAIGAVLGGIAGGGKGAVLGGAVGAGVGVAGVLLSKGEEAEVPSGTTFGVQLKQGLSIRESFISETAPPADPSADQPTGRPDRADSADSRPDSTDRAIPSRAEAENRTEPERADTPAPLPLSSPEMVRKAQGALKEQGYYEGEADGVMSPRTAGALRTYQREHNLPESGDLDPQTAKSLGIMGGSPPRDRVSDRPRDSRSESVETSNNELANVLSASASKTADGGIYVSVNTQANTGGWRWFEEHVVNGDTLEVYARAIRPTGMVTQVLTRGRIETTVKDGVNYVRRVVVHGAGGDKVIALESRTSGGSGREVAAPDTGEPPSAAPSSAVSIQRKAEELLSEYQRIYGVRMTGSGVQVENAAQYREPEIELLFAIDSFANAAQLYTRLTSSLRDRQSLRGATLGMAKQARRTDRVIATTTSRGADPLAARWDSIREDVLQLMQTYNINSSEIEN
ncbi:MAG TPA: peptidoglycan-binding protein [Blastocatellia bacterium]|nr:peptidoglycan-binding protein [Blastocatellia bacterium]